MLAALLLAACACSRDKADPSLSKVTSVIRTADVPPADGPKLGAISELVAVYGATDASERAIGLLHAGAQVARSAEPLSYGGCNGGWYAVRPRGFVCRGNQATLDLNHPTLSAMALAPTLSSDLPYTYARTRKPTPLLLRDPDRSDGVREAGKLSARAGLAVVGSWSAKEANGQTSRLALLTSGRFVRSTDLEAAKPSEFHGAKLDEQRSLPLAFVVKRGVRAFTIEDNRPEKGALLEYHAQIPLLKRFRNLGTQKYWAIDAGRWVRQRDLTVIMPRTIFPEFAVNAEQRWLDVSIGNGTLVAYRGKVPIYATLVSASRGSRENETTPAAEGPEPVALGSFPITEKHLTLLSRDTRGFGESFELLDVPWVLELGSGQVLHGAFWHDRFGIAHGAGSVELSPADARFVFEFAGPTLPEGWHSVALAPGETPTYVVLRR